MPRRWKRKVWSTQNFWFSNSGTTKNIKHMKKRYYFKACILMTLLFFVGLSSCKKINRIATTATDDWNPDVALTIVNTRISSQDLLAPFQTGGAIEIEPNGSMKVIYQGNVISSTGEEIVNIDDFTTPVVESSQAANFPFPIPIAASIEIVDLKAGTLEYTLQSPLNEGVTVVLQFPATQNGQVLEQTVVLANDNSVTGSFSLANSRFDFSTTTNEFPIQYTATRQSDGQTVSLSNAQVAFSNLEYSYLQGRIDRYVFDFPLDTVVLGFFNNWRQGETYFEEPKLDFIIRNSFGVPIRLDVNRLEARTYKSGLMTLSDDPQLQNGVDFNYPSLTEVGEVKTTVVTLDNTSNLPTVLQNIPYELYYELNAAANPDNDTSVVGHLTDTSNFEVDINVELPLYGWTRGFEVEDTFYVDLSVYDQFNALDFKLITENGFPMEAKMQLYFEDESGRVLDSLIREEATAVLTAAPVDGSGRVTEEVVTTTIVSFPEERYSNIRRLAKIIRLKATFETTNAGTESIRIYSDYEMGIKLGIKGNLDIQAL